MSPDLVPALDPTPIPGPAWLFHVLLVLTFFLHVVFLNLTLGGTLLAAVAQSFAGGRAGDPRTVLAARLMRLNTYGISFTITTGVAPLLFVQVLYQPLFYTATLLIAGAWLAMLGLLLLGYYSAYVYKFRGAPAHGGGGTVWLWLSAALFLAIAAVHVAVNLIHSQPAGWVALAEHPWSVLRDHTFGVRLLHFVAAAVAWSAVVVTWWSVREARAGREVELNRGIARFAWRWALGALVLQVIDGFALLLLVPRRLLAGLFEGGAATLVPLAAAVLLGLGLLLMLARVRDPVAEGGAVTAVAATLVVVVAAMSVTRHQVRALYLEPLADSLRAATAPQWALFALFAMLLVAALAAVGWIAWLARRRPGAGEVSA